MKKLSQDISYRKIVNKIWPPGKVSIKIMFYLCYKATRNGMDFPIENKKTGNRDWFPVQNKTVYILEEKIKMKNMKTWKSSYKIYHIQKSWIKFDLPVKVWLKSCVICVTKQTFKPLCQPLEKRQVFSRALPLQRLAFIQCGHYKNGMSPQFHFRMKFITACQEILLLCDSKHGCGTDSFSSPYLRRHNNSWWCHCAW